MKTLKTIKDLISKPVAVMCFILVVALLIIISNNSSTINDLRAEVDSTNAEILMLETTLEATANEIAVRDDAIAGLTSSAKDAIAGWESANALSVELEVTVADLESQLTASALAVADLGSQLADAGSTLADVRQELSDTKTLLDVCVNTPAQ